MKEREPILIEHPRGQSVVLLPTSWCLHWHFSKQEQRLLTKRTSLAFALEEHLPVDGDDLAISRLRSRKGTLVVCTLASRLTSWMESLKADAEETIDPSESNQDRANNTSSIIAVVPRAFAVLTEAKTVHPIHRLTHLAIESPSSWDLFALQDGRVIQWYWTPKNSIDEIVARAADGSDAESLRIGWIRSKSDVNSGSHFNENEGVELQLDADSAASEHAAKILSGKVAPLINLAEGPLANEARWQTLRRPATAFFIACLLFQAVLAGILLWRINRFDAIAAEALLNQEAAYRRVFPRGALPVGLTPRLESEHRQLTATRGGASDTTPPNESVLPIANALLKAIPTDQEIRFRFRQIILEPDRLVELIGVARTFTVLETLTSSLREVGFKIPPPSSIQVGEGIAIGLEDLQWQCPIGKNDDRESDQ